MTNRTLLCLFIIINLGGHGSDLCDLTTYDLGALYATGRWRNTRKPTTAFRRMSYRACRFERGEPGTAVSAFFERHDLFNCPVYHDAPAPPCRGEFEQRVVCAFPGMVNQLGLPAASLYAGMIATGLPVAVQTVDSHHGDCIGVVGEPYARTRVVACPVR